MGPIWSDDGSELFYLRQPANSGPDAVMRVLLDVVEGDPPSLNRGTPERLFEWQYFSTPTSRRRYDVLGDGQRFLVMTRGGAADVEVERSQINVVFDWFEELKALVPVP